MSDADIRLPWNMVTEWGQVSILDDAGRVVANRELTDLTRAQFLAIVSAMNSLSLQNPSMPTGIDGITGRDLRHGR